MVNTIASGKLRRDGAAQFPEQSRMENNGAKMGGWGRDSAFIGIQMLLNLQPALTG